MVEVPTITGYDGIIEIKVQLQRIARIMYYDPRTYDYETMYDPTRDELEEILKRLNAPKERKDLSKLENLIWLYRKIGSLNHGRHKEVKLFGELCIKEAMRWGIDNLRAIAWEEHKKEHGMVYTQDGLIYTKEG